MAPTRRLRGIAALSAGALATVGLSSGVTAADECTDEACDDSAVSITELIKAFGGSEISDAELEQMESFFKVIMGPGAQGNEFSPESVSQLLELYCQMGIDIPAEAFIKIPTFSEDLSNDALAQSLTEDAMAKLAATYEQLGIDIPAEALADMEELLIKFDTDPAGVAAIDGFSDTEDALTKVIFDKSSPLLIDVDDVLPLIEEALLKRADSGQTDTASVRAILEMLAQEE